MMFSGPQFEKTDQTNPKPHEFNSSLVSELPSLTSSYFPFHSDSAFPNPYHFPYTFTPLLPYFSNPYFSPYSHIAWQQQPNQPNQLEPSPQTIPVKHEAVEQPSPIIAKAEAIESQEPQQKSVQENQNQPQKKSEAEKISQRKQYYNIKKKPNVNIQIKRIFKKLIKCFLVQQPTSKERLQLKRQLKKIDRLGSDLFFEILVDGLRKKFADFKKTKEELIKYIIRRSYHNYKIGKGSEYRPEQDRLQQFHERNLSVHKSMNNDFLKKEFSNKLFVEIYKEFLDQMDDQFEQENEQRIQRLSYTLCSVWAQKSIKQLSRQKKMPWNVSYKKRVKQIAVDMLKEYEGTNDQNKQEEPAI